MHRFRVVVLLALTLALTATLGAWPQLGLPGLPKRLPREVPRLDLPSPDDLLNRQPLTSTLDDAVTEVPFLDRFDTETGAPLLELPFGFADGPRRAAEVLLMTRNWPRSIQFRIKNSELRTENKDPSSG